VRLIPAIKGGSGSKFVGDNTFLEFGDTISNLAACNDKFDFIFIMVASGYLTVISLG
jgi:hypothetical protein